MARRALIVAAAAACLLLVGCGGEGESGRREITIEHSSFGVGSLQVEAGERVTFVIHNDDPIDHEFIIGDEAMQLVHEKGTEAHHGARDGEISIPANSTRTTSYSFPDGGRLIFGCHLPGHYRYGMKGYIEIG